MVNIIEKPERKIGNIINTGVYNFNKDIFKMVEQEVRSASYGITRSCSKDR